MTNFAMIAEILGNIGFFLDGILSFVALLAQLILIFVA